MAARYFINGGVNNNWNSTTNWSDTSNGAGGFSVPISTTDDVFLDAFSPNCNINTAALGCKTLTCTGYINTLAFSTFTLSLRGNVILAAAMGISGTGTLDVITAATLTSNGKVFSVNLKLNSTIVYTLADNWTISGTFTSGGTINGNNIYIQANYQSLTTTGGTTIFNFIGTGSWTSTGNGVFNPIVINTAGTLTISGTVRAGGQSITYTTGTVVTTGSTLNLAGSTTTFNTSGMTWNNIAMVSNGGITLTSDLNLAGTLTSTGTIATLGAFNINVASLTATLAISGTSTIVFNSTGTWSGSGQVAVNLTINTAGTITLSGTIRKDGGTITYTAGTIVNTGSTWSCLAATTINTSGMTWNNITISGTTTITNNSLLTLNGSLSYALSSIITFTGTAGWTTASFFILTANNVSHKLVAGLEYIVTTYFESITTTTSLKDSLISATPGTKAIFTLNPSATQNVGYTNAVDIDSSRGQTIWTFNGVVTTTLNWNSFNSSTGLQKKYIF